MGSGVVKVFETKRAGLGGGARSNAQALFHFAAHGRAGWEELPRSSLNPDPSKNANGRPPEKARAKAAPAEWTRDMGGPRATFLRWTFH